MAVRFSALLAGRALPPGKIWYTFVLDRRVMVLLEGLGKLKNSSTSSKIEPASFWFVA
jgi:hypothetical protein